MRLLPQQQLGMQSELTLREGQLVSVLRQDETGWWEGCHETSGEIGWFPSNFTHFKHELWTIEEIDDENSDEEGE